MTEPEFIYNYERFDNGEEALDAFHNTPNIDYKHGIRFLDWLVWKITKPTRLTPRWHKNIWETILERAMSSCNETHSLENRDAILRLNCNDGKDVFDLWMKWEINNPNTGSVVEDKRWIVDWFFDPINDDLKHEIYS